MEVLTSLLTSGQLGQLKDISQSVSLEEVAEVASSGFRSLSATREDSLVFVLGLLNMATVLMYAVYAEMFKPARKSWASTIGSPSDDQHFFYKKIQNILDELVLHVHTSTYYRNAIERARLSSRFQGRSGEPAATFHGLLSFFEIPGLTPKDPAATSRRTRDDYDVYLKREARKLMQEWISVLVQSTFAETLSGRLFKRHVTYRSNATANEQRARKRSSTSRSPRMNHQVDDDHLEHEKIDRQHADAVVRHLTKRQVSQQNRTSLRRLRPQARRQPGAQRRILPISMQQKLAAQHKSDEWSNHSAGPIARRRLVKQPEHPTTTTPATTTTTPPAPSITERFRQEVPVLPVQGLFPQGTVRQGNAGRTSGRDNTPTHAKVVSGSVPRYQTPAPLYYDGELDLDASGSSPAGAHSPDSNLVDRLMHLIQQTTPLAMDVLHVFKTQADPVDGHHPPELKCFERQLCQLNHEWKKKGIVSAALAPFLSISIGWWRDRTSGPSLADALMAVRAGWIGKHCPTLYPRCSNTGRPQWAVVPTSGDSANQQSAGRPPIKVPPPVGFVNQQQQPVRPSTSIAQVAQRPPVNPAPPMRKRDDTLVDWSGEEPDPVRVQRPIDSRLDDLSPSSSVATGSLQVDNAANNAGVKSDSYAANKPWGKPSRFPVTGNVELSDIVRGVYPPSDQMENDSEDNDEEDEEHDDDEGDDDGEEEEGDGVNQSSTEKVSSHLTEEILHDLKKNHFGSTKAPTTQTNSTKATETKSAELIKYEEMQKKKTHRLEMVPHRGLVHPWLADPVWAPESRWPGKPAPVNKQVEDEADATDRHRDRVSFSHEDAVKDYRIQDYAMQFLRDRSA